MQYGSRRATSRQLALGVFKNVRALHGRLSERVRCWNLEDNDITDLNPSKAHRGLRDGNVHALPVVPLQAHIAANPELLLLV
eukprot:9488256-Pyramimonas_sp.AAC.2